MPVSPSSSRSWIPRSWIRCLAAPGVVAVLASASHSAGAASAAGLVVATSVPPQGYLLERVGTPHVTTRVLVPRARSPETYAPTPSQRIGLSQARLYLSVGHPRFAFEHRHVDPFLAKNPEIRVVSMAEHADRNGADDPHLWLSPAIVSKTVDALVSMLGDLDPEHSHDYEANGRRLQTEIGALIDFMRSHLADLRGRAFLVYHPAWGHLASEYGLEELAIENQGKAPGPARLAALIERARADGMRVVFVQPGFPTKNAEAIAREIGARLVELDPLAYDWIAGLRQTTLALREAILDD